PYSGMLAWKKQDGTSIGEGNPFVLRDAAPGEWQIVATAVDQYGAQASDTLRMSIYTPVSKVIPTVNNGLPTYMVSEAGGPLNARVDFSGGIAPTVSWTLRQEDRSAEKSGREAVFTYGELASFSEAAAIMTVSVTDPGLLDEDARQIFRGDYPILLTRNVVAELASPLPGDIFWAGEAVPVSVRLTGFSAPSFSMTIDDTDSGGAWTPLEGTTLYGSQVSALLVQEEGVYELSIKVGENGLSRVVPFTLNVYRQRSGVFVDNAPSEYDLENGPGRVEAVVAGLAGIDLVQWRSDLAADPVGSGTALDLASAGLSPGNRSITVEALSGSRVVSSFSFPLRVYGAMELRVTPEAEPLIVQKGAQVSLDAVARDRDGSVIGGDAITWTSHVDGLLGRGASLALGSLANLSLGEHILTVVATGSNGGTVSALRRIQMNPAPAAPPGQSQTRGPSSDFASDGRYIGPPAVVTIVQFIGGNPIQSGGNRSRQFGPGGTQLSQDLRNRMLGLLGNNDRFQIVDMDTGE
ncbi:MAG: hypothetical protein WAZ31_09380, partial [Rectinemataceae bacterium]